MLSEESVPVTGFSPMTEFRSTSTPLIHRLSHPYHSEFDFDPASIPSGIRSWLAQRNDRRPRSLVLIGPSRTGKTELARSLGHHIYWNGYYNLDKYDETAELPSSMTSPWDRFHYMAKQWLGAQRV